MEMVAVVLSRRLAERGHRVSFMARPGTRIASEIRTIGGAAAPVRIGKRVDPNAVFRLRRWIRRERVDVVHVHYAKDLWVLSPALGGNPAVPLVLTKHIGTLKAKRDPLHRFLYRRVDCIAAISEVIRRNVAATHPVPPECVVTIPNGVDTALFRVAAADRRAVRTAFGFPPDATVIGIAGRLNWWKGYREFLFSAEHLLRSNPGLWFLAVGGATFREEREAEAIRALARQLDLKGRMIFAGYRDDMPSCYAAMDLFVYPAYAEAFGLVLIEAMAAGLPVVSTDCDAVPEIVENGVTGDLVPARNTERLAEAVAALLADPERMRRYGRAGQNRVETWFHINRTVEQIERLYERLIDQRKCI